MKNIALSVAIAIAVIFAFAGCRSVNPATGTSEFDPVKTAKITALVRAGIADAVLIALKQDKNAGPYISAAAQAVCSVAGHPLDPVKLRETFAASSAKELRTVEAQVAINQIAAIYEAAWADRFRADVNANDYAREILTTLCDGMNLGLAQAKDLGLIQ